MRYIDHIRNMSDLVSQIKQYAKDYYEGHPSISDAAFDGLVNELKRTDPSNPILNQVGWGYVIDNPLQKKQNHRYEVAKFENKVRDYRLIDIPYDRARISTKIDGGSCMCYYDNGNLTYAITRGDGIQGYDITPKFVHLVPTSLKDTSFTGMVRGEITMRLDVFNAKYSEYESVRNFAIGLIKRNQITIDQLNDLEFVAYTVRGNTDRDISSKDNVYKWIVDNGFNKVDELTCNDWSDDNFRTLIKSYNKYLIDGIVITDNKYNKQDDGTWIPNEEVAYKTSAETAQVVVTDVDWNLTRTGAFYPRAWIEPVKLSGAVISKATAFNAKFIKDNGIGKGAVIEIQRSGEVIPDIIRVITPVNPSIPEVCPYCGHKLEWKGVHICCTNDNCEGKNSNKLMHWITCKAPVKGLGWSNITDFINNYDLKTVDDLYTKKDHILSDIDNYIKGTETHKLIVEMVNKLYAPVNFDLFMICCNLKMVGWSAVEHLNKYYEDILNSPVDNNLISRINEIKGVNITGKSSIINNLSMIRRYANYITVNKVSEKVESNVSTIGVTITGKLSMSRSKFVEMISKYGYKEVSIEKAEMLITDNPNSGSAKCKRAHELGKKIVSEEEFMKLINN